MTFQEAFTDLISHLFPQGLPEKEYRERERMFMSGARWCFFTMTKGAGGLPEEDAISHLIRLDKELDDYFKALGQQSNQPEAN